MAITSKRYGLFESSLANEEVDWVSDTIKVAQHTASYVPNQDTHQYWDVSVNNECSGSGYTAGGATLGSCTVTYDTATNTTKYDAADISAAWTSNTVTNCRYLVIYDSTPASNKPLVAYVDLGEDSQVLSVVWHANGITTVTDA
jgi:hypothetical protein